MVVIGLAGLPHVISGAAVRAEEARSLDENPPTSVATNRAMVDKVYRDRLKRYGSDGNFFIRRGLIADRRKRSVRIQAEAIAMNTIDPVEFFLIAEDSGHDYEALAYSFARPSDIHQALEFIGMTAGRPVNYEKLFMWPKGERVWMTFSWEEQDASGNVVARQEPAEKLIIDSRSGRHLPVEGFCFVGSQWVAGEGDAKPVYAADVYDPESIASDYNEPLTVLDIPRKVVQGEVYGYQRVNPRCRLPAGSLVEIILRPEFSGGQHRVVDLSLRVLARRGGGGRGMKCMRFVLETPAGERLGRGDRLKDMLAVFERLEEKGHDIFLTVRPDHALKLICVRDFYIFLSGMLKGTSLRIEPPVEGDLYYRAFLPPESLRDPKRRPGQPWELHLDRMVSGTLTGRLVHIEEIWHGDEEQPEFKSTAFACPGPAALAERLGPGTGGLPVLLVFADPDITYGGLLDFIHPVTESRPTVYVFLESSSSAADRSAARCQGRYVP